MTETRTPTAFMLSREVLDALQEKTQHNLRSRYVDDVLRRELGLPPGVGRVGGWRVYQKIIDHGMGRHIVCVNDGVIVAQHLACAPGQHYSYTGDGNPEWVGCPTPTIYGMGFKLVRSDEIRRQERDAWLSE